MTARAKALAIPRIEDDRLIATEWRMAPGSETGWHRHGHDYAVVCLTTGELFVETKDGLLTACLERGQVTERRHFDWPPGARRWS